ncbi:MAG: hypothetical protein AAF600_20555 [Bacteroidota bacterium]
MATFKVESLFDNRKSEITEEVIAGGSNGAIIVINIGGKIDVFISCAWRLFRNDTQITGWHEESVEKTSPLVSGIKKLEGLKFVSCSFHSEFDFDLCFEGGFTLSVFADNTAKSRIDENWAVCDISSNKCYTLSNEYALSEDVYDDPQQLLGDPK